ncbi:MAG: Ig-like domain-containing protein, partial [Planctomycetota bacterium]
MRQLFNCIILPEKNIIRIPVIIFVTALFVFVFSTPAEAGQVANWEGNVDSDYMRDENWSNGNAPDQNNDEAIILDASPNPDPILSQTERINTLTLTSGVLTVMAPNELQLTTLLRGTSGRVLGTVRSVNFTFDVSGTPTVENFIGSGFLGTVTILPGAYFRCTDSYEQVGFMTTLQIQGGGTVDCTDFNVTAWNTVEVQSGGVLLVNGGSYAVAWGAAYTDYLAGSVLRFRNTTLSLPFADDYWNLESTGDASVRDLNAATVNNNIVASFSSDVQMIGATVAGSVITDGTSFVVIKDYGGTNDYRFWGNCAWTEPAAAYDTATDESIYIMPGANVTLDADVEVASLDVAAGAALNLNGYTLTVTGNAAVYGTVNGASGGGIDVGGNCLIDGTYNANGETLDVAGTLTVSGTYDGFSGTCRVNGLATVTNAGLMDLDDALTVELGTGIVIDGVFRTQNKPTVTNDGAGNYSFNVSASGTLDVGGLSFFNADTSGMVVADSATITSLSNVDFAFIGTPGIADGTALQILDTSQTFTFTTLYFDNDAQYNVRTASAGVSVTVDGWDGPGGGPDYENDNDSGRVDPGTIDWQNYLGARPEIVFRDPDIGQVDVAITTSVTMRWDRQMDQATILNIDGFPELSTCRLEDSLGSFINCNLSFPNQYTAVLTPDAPLTPAETYTVTVEDTIADIFGTTIFQNSWTFTCVPANTLTVTQIPVPASNRPEGGTFLVQWFGLSAGASMPIDVLSMTFAMNGTAPLSDVSLVELYLDGGVLGDWTDDGAPLASGTYAVSTVTLSPGLTVPAGGVRFVLLVYTLAAPAADTNPNSTVDADLTAVSVNSPNVVSPALPIASADFTVVTPPAVYATYPADSQTGIFTAVTISVTFDEAMDQATIVNVDGDPGGVSSYRLIRELDSSFVNCDLSFAGSDRAELTPDVELNSNEWYRVVIDTRVTDTAGNAFPALYSFIFQCGAPGTWDGEGDPDDRWTLGVNWDADATPGQNDSVQIPSAASVPINPNINQNRRILNVLLASGAVLNFNSGAQLRVIGDFIAQDGVDGQAVVNIDTNNSRLRVDGNFFNDGQIIARDGSDGGVVWFDGGGALQTWRGSGFIEVWSNTERITLDVNSNVVLGSSHTVRGGEFYVSNGAAMSLDLGGYTLALDFYGAGLDGGHMLVGAGGVFNCGDGTLRIAGIPVINGTFNRGTGTFYYFGTSQTIVDTVYHNLRFGAGATYDLPVGPTLVEGDWIIDLATIVNYDVSSGLTVNGNWLDDGTFNHNSGVVTLNGAGVIDANTSGAGTESFNNLNITGNRALSANDTMTVAGLLDISGTFNSGTSTTINVIAGQVNRTGTVAPGTGTWIYTGAGDSGDFDVYNLIASVAVTMPGDYDVLNDLRVNGGGSYFVNGRKLKVGNDIIIEGAGDTLDASVAGSQIEIGGDWLNDGTFVYGTSSVEFSGTSLLDVVIGTDAEETMYDVLITGSLTIQAGDNLNVINNLSIAAGATLSVGVDSTLYVTAPNFTMDPASSFAAGANSTVIASGTGSIPSATYENLIITGDVDMSAPIQVNGDLTIETGATFDVNGSDLTIRGDVEVIGTLDATDGGRIFIEGDW